MPAGDQRYLTSRVAGKPAALKEVVVAGAAANTNIPIAGIKTTDVLVSCLEFLAPGNATGVAVIDRTAETSITSAGNIQATVATNTSVDNRLIVKYYSV